MGTIGLFCLWLLLLFLVVGLVVVVFGLFCVFLLFCRACFAFYVFVCLTCCLFGALLRCLQVMLIALVCDLGICYSRITFCNFGFDLVFSVGFSGLVCYFR